MARAVKKLAILTVTVIVLIHATIFLLLLRPPITEHFSYSEWDFQYGETDRAGFSLDSTAEGTSSSHSESRKVLLQDKSSSDGAQFAYPAVPPVGTVSHSQQKVQQDSKHLSSQRQIHQLEQIADPVSPNIDSDESIVSTIHPVSQQVNPISKQDKLHAIRERLGGNRSGFVFAIHFHDQQTYSAGNMLSLQVWATWLGIHMVEPFLVGTKFKIPLADNKAFYSNGTVSYLRMRDIYDMDDWNAQSGRQYHHHLAPLVSWDYFFENAPKEVVYIRLAEGSNKCTMRKEAVLYNRTLSKLGFKMIRHECVMYSWTQSVTLAHFKSQIYKDCSPSEVTVILEEWSHSTVSHVLINDHDTLIGGSSSLALRPSKMILNDTERYMAKYLPSGGKYVGVLLRTEWLIMNRGSDKREKILHQCLNSSVAWLRAVMKQKQIDNVFVGMDVGRYGSSTLKDLTSDYVLQSGNSFLRTLYPATIGTSVSGLEHTFEEISRSKVPGYVAFLQKMIATRGQCLVLVGFGSFQNHALSVYMKHHQRREHCYLKTDSLCRAKSIVGLSNIS